MRRDGEPGLFITFEGGEGVGKSTQIALLRQALETRDHRVVATREPGGSPKAELIRSLLLSGAVAPFGTAAEAMLFAAARADHVAATIWPALGRGVHVLCDRFIDSTRAYQGALGAVPPGLIEVLEDLAVGTTRPDLTIILDMPADLGLARAHARRQGREAADRFEREDQTFHDALRRAFLSVAAADPARCVVVEADRDVTQVAAVIWTIVETRLAAARSVCGTVSRP